MNKTLGIYTHATYDTPQRYLGFIPGNPYSYTDNYFNKPNIYSKTRLRSILSPDKLPYETAITEWLTWVYPTITLSVQETIEFLTLYTADIIEYRCEVSKEDLLATFTDIITKLSNMDPGDRIDLCWR